jgi:hypothetical protein
MVDGPRAWNNTHGCLNPLCPHANWSEANLPRWWLRLDDGQISEFAACDDACAQAAVRLLQARSGRADLGAHITQAKAFA